MCVAESDKLIETKVTGDKDREDAGLKAGLLSEGMVCAWLMESFAVQLGTSGQRLLPQWGFLLGHYHSCTQ